MGKEREIEEQARICLEARGIRLYGVSLVMLRGWGSAMSLSLFRDSPNGLCTKVA